MASRQFVEDFKLVSEHYELERLGEIEAAKQAARDDMESAEICFREMAKRIGVEMKKREDGGPCVPRAAARWPHKGENHHDL